MNKKLIIILIIATISGYFLYKNSTYKYILNNIPENNKDFYNPPVPDYTQEQCEIHNEFNEGRRKFGYHVTNDITLIKNNPVLFDTILSDGYTFNKPRKVKIFDRDISNIINKLSTIDSWLVPNYPENVYEGKSYKNAKYMFGTNYRIIKIAPAFCQEFKNIEEFKAFFSKINHLDYIILYYDSEKESRTDYYIKILFTEGSISDIIDVVNNIKLNKRIRSTIFRSSVLNKYKDTDIYIQYLNRPIH